ncbi:SGNH/GDSL hydrolase family protein [bacterium]|nr:SGNH/GDSL hydrolase family protein [bacterium]
MGSARTLWLTLVCGLAVAMAAPSFAQDTAKAKKKAAPNPAFAPVTDVAGLPRVLIIGDSISIGYTVDVREMLAGKANVHRIPTNGGPTTNGLKNIDAWLGDKPWDVIHFNWGLHDLKYITPDNPAALADPKLPDSRQQVPLDEYEQNLAKLVERMKATGATLIWCSTTPVPEGSAGRIAGDEQKYNAAAAQVMTTAGVQTNDLCAYAQPKLAEIQLPKNVHYTPAGSKVLAEKVAAEITAALEQRAKAAK